MVNYNKQKPYLTEIPKPTESTHVDRSSRPSTPDRQTGRQAAIRSLSLSCTPDLGPHGTPRPHLPLAIHLSAAVGLGEGRLKHVVLQQADGQGGGRDAVRGAWLALALGLGLGLGLVVVLAPHLWARGAQPSEEPGAALGARACVSACAARTCACACADAADAAAAAAGCGCRHARWCRRAWCSRQRRHRCIAWRVMAALRSAAAAAAAAARVAPAVATVL